MAKISLVCPNPQCQNRSEVDEVVLGKTVRCDRCQTTFVIARPAMDTNPEAWATGRVLLDDYEIERPLGQGGMGTVYLVRSRSNGQRFAVKTILRDRLGDESSQRRFLDELQTWIDLPEHPHLAACHFFRTVGNQVAIFAEYVEGGSLADWIWGRKLTRLDQMLDVAIQFAWGLHAVHELGLIHQDVKPGNVLLTDQGQVKVADFGLALTRAMTRGTGQAGGPGERVSDLGTERITTDPHFDAARDDSHSVAVTGAGMTERYASPEQAAGKPLTRKTDLWSWGVSVLEMFTGEATWPVGWVAHAALEDYVATGPGDSQLPGMPPSLAEVLRKCFRPEAAERWSNLAEVAEALRPVYRQAIGTDYPRSAPPATDRKGRVLATHDRRTTRGGQWRDPREWLTRAFQAEGRDPAGIEALLPARTGSRKAQAIADLAAYGEAVRIFERLIAGGQQDLETQLAALCLHKSFIHEDVDDIPGALALFDRAIALYERLVEREGRRELADGLAVAYMNKANALSGQGDLRAAVALHDRAIALYERLVEREGRRELADELAKA